MPKTRQKTDRREAREQASQLWMGRWRGIASRPYGYSEQRSAHTSNSTPQRDCRHHFGGRYFKCRRQPFGRFKSYRSLAALNQADVGPMESCSGGKGPSAEVERRLFAIVT